VAANGEQISEAKILILFCFISTLLVNKDIVFGACSSALVLEI
jgi:hypothetical protein